MMGALCTEMNPSCSSSPSPMQRIPRSQRLVLRKNCGPSLRTCRLHRRRSALGAHGDNAVTPSAPPLPPELRTTERVKYPAVYKGSDYATGATGLAEGQPPVEESNLAEDTVEAQEQDYTDYQTQAVGHGSSRQNNFYQAVDASPPAQFIRQTRWAQPLLGALGLFFVGTFLLSAVRVFRRYNSPRSKRTRTVNLNKAIVESLDAYLPANRAALTTGVMRGLKMKSGFSSTEIFRKYLWYLLRERKFDEDAVADLAALRTALGMTDEEVAEALRERAQRIYEKYGNVMLEVAGMTKAGIERKATCRALFSKILFLAESEKILDQESEAAQNLSIPKIFGATDEDTDGLRIVSLYEVDLDNLEGQFDKDSNGP
ncbi:hypothetical protein COCSUDRAFT_47354 [Coccomyxa subellipsoidea C-169]|uniref:Armadillo-like repeats domain-containing protein n=1 Tax=Coccomyxa subellipsoidea (strain C-169) TaxID=574566 RepID=I0YYW2_COCSC|nr:hypothetical protein COCSUDRAFT_47354 [Coccomyxa subellipsoidea C-169]EIE23581.1 hypothetical protein COCSUDRAFT_47354 [Coccomyxa subellipsoidea C-169]|eukprot:XP_005648125.1 hypothetical protein COCSUDRAFT_47354 [Coccomyxa subellipsoidea C-169]